MSKFFEGAHLGEAGTEQFTITVQMGDGTSKTDKIHDPFVTCTVVDKFSRWSAFKSVFQGEDRRTIKTVVSVWGSHSAQSRIMTMNPFVMQMENAAWEKDCAERAAAGGFLPGDGCAQATTRE